MLPVSRRLIASPARGRVVPRHAGEPAVPAFRRSARLTRGHRWRAVFLSTLLVWIGCSLPWWPFWMANAVAILAGSALLPFAAIGLTLPFYDVRQEEARATPADL